MALMEQFKDCQPLVPLLRQSGVSIEKKLAEFREQATTFPQLHRSLAAIQYYLHFALWNCQDQWRTKHLGTTNFATLLFELERWRYEKKEQVCFVTFNYDTMLEEAMSQVLRLEVRDMDSYIKWDNYSLLKLHGSINWGRVVEGISKNQGETSNDLCQRIIDMMEPRSEFFTNEYKLCSHDMHPLPIKPSVLHGGMAGPDSVLYPALSIPVENKDEFSCPAKHVTALEALLPKVTKVITIGWRATEAEFLRMLKFSRQMPYSGVRPVMRLLIVTGSKDGAGETLTNLLRVGGETPDLFQHLPTTPVTTGFTGLINNLATLGAFLRG